MSIKETLEKIKPFYPVLLIVVFSGFFFVLGRFSALDKSKGSIRVEYSPESISANVVSINSSTTPEIPKTVVPSGEVIGSKSGKKYYFPWCGTVKRIKPENQVHFASIEEAKKAGFTAGGNCKGLQ